MQSNRSNCLLETAGPAAVASRASRGRVQPLFGHNISRRRPDIDPKPQKMPRLYARDGICTIRLCLEMSHECKAAAAYCQCLRGSGIRRGAITPDIRPVAVYHVKGRRGAEIDNNQVPRTRSCPATVLTERSAPRPVPRLPNINGQSAIGFTHHNRRVL